MPRLAWLDALRGVAATAVVLEHLTFLVFRGLRDVTDPWFDLGTYGVLVFFLVSGYIVPASLERGGSVRRFWISRAFRLYPAFALAGALALALVATGLSHPPTYPAGRPAALAAHLTFLQDLLNVPSYVNVFWTLSYEMIFYLAVTGLFVLGAHGRSAETGLGLAAAALLTGGAFGWALPSMALSRGPVEIRLVTAAVVALLAAGLAAAMGRGRAGRRAGAVLLLALCVTLMAANQRTGAWQGLVILSFMFAGTAVYRAHHGQTGPVKAYAAVAGCTVLGVLSGVLPAPGWGLPAHKLVAFQWTWTAAVLAAVATFVAGLGLRHRARFGGLAWTGRVSYSMYLLHPLLLVPLAHVMRPYVLPVAVEAAVFAAFFAALLTCSAVAFRYVEAPGQRLGRRLARRYARASVPRQENAEIRHDRHYRPGELFRS